MRNEHITPEEADHTEDVDDRADDQKALHARSCDRTSELDKREHDGITQIRKQIERRSDSIAFLFIVVVADEVIRLPPRDVEYKEDAESADDQHGDPQHDITVEVFEHLCPVALLYVGGGVGIIQEEVPEKIAEAHTVVHDGRQQDERSAQRSQLSLFEYDQQDGADQDVHQRRRAGEHGFPEDRVEVCCRGSFNGTRTAERQ